MQLNHHSKQKLKIRALTDPQRTSTNLTGPRSQRQTPRVKAKISKQITNITVSKILLDLKPHVKIALNEDEINRPLMVIPPALNLRQNSSILKLKQPIIKLDKEITLKEVTSSFGVSLAIGYHKKSCLR
jgi:hypothetical protein